VPSPGCWVVLVAVHPKLKLKMTEDLGFQKLSNIWWFKEYRKVMKQLKQGIKTGWN